MTLEDKARFLDAVPWLLDDVQAIDAALGRDICMDWNKVDKEIRKLLNKKDKKWKLSEHKLFRDVFTKKDKAAEKVLKRKDEYEPDPELRDYENVPLEQDIDEYFKIEVAPHVPDAWMDRTKDKLGYEINFNRCFYVHTPPRSLKVIDAELKEFQAKTSDNLKTSFKAEGQANWRHIRLKFLATINDETLPEDTDPDLEINYLDIGDVDSLGSVNPPTKYNFIEAPSRARRVVRHGDVIISTVRTYLQAITAIENPIENLIVSTGFAVIRPKGDLFYPGFCKYALRESSFLDEVQKRSVGANYPSINAPELGNIFISVPAYNEQVRIAGYLDSELAVINKMKIAAEKSLNLLSERRGSLISKATTLKF